MSRYLTKPKPVDAWVIDPDDANPPEWVVEAFDKGATTMSDGDPPYGAIVWNDALEELDLWSVPRYTGERGDILIRDGDGHLSVITPEDFERDYELEDAGIMLWDAEDPENSIDDIEEYMMDECSIGTVLRVCRAKRLPDEYYVKSISEPNENGRQVIVRGPFATRAEAIEAEGTHD